MIGNVWDNSILYAGLVRCPVCGRAAYPSDAGWLDEQLIVASFAAVCAHYPACIIVINPYRLAVAPGDPSRYLPGRRCAGRADRRRRPCRAYAMPGSDFCSSHGRDGAAGMPA